MSIKPGGTPLNQLFDPYVEGTKTCPAGEVIEGGTDIRDKYAPIEFGSKGADTGVKIGTTDISNYFAAAGTASYFPPAPWSGESYSAIYNTQDTSSPYNSKVTLEFLANGNFNAYESTPNGTVLADSGSFLPAGATASEYEIICVHDSGDPLTLNEISSWTQLSTNKYVELRYTGIATSSRSCSITIVVRKIGQTNESFGSCFLLARITN